MCMRRKVAATCWACVARSAPAAGLLLHLCNSCMHMALSGGMQTVQSPVKRTCMCISAAQLSQSFFFQKLTAPVSCRQDVALGAWS